MTEEEYRAVMDELKAERLAHAAKGSSWKKHKYLRIENGRYIYPEDDAGEKGKSPSFHDSASAKWKEAKDSGKVATVKKPKEDIREMQGGVKSPATTNIGVASKLADRQMKADEDLTDEHEDKFEEKWVANTTKNPEKYIDSIAKKTEDLLYNAFMNGELKENGDLADSVNEKYEKIAVEIEAVSEAFREKYGRTMRDEAERATYAALAKALDNAVNKALKDGAKLPKDFPIDDIKKEIKEMMTEYGGAPYTDATKVHKLGHSFDSREAFYAAVYDYKQSHKR